MLQGHGVTLPRKSVQWLLAYSIGTCLVASPAVSAQQGTGRRWSATRQFSLAAVRSGCIDFTDVKRGNDPSDLRDCRVSEFGEIGSVDRETYYFAIYCLIPNDAQDRGTCGDASFSARYYERRGLAVFAGAPSSQSVRLVFERAGGEPGLLVYPRKPEIIRSGAVTLLHLLIAIDGTANGNASEYFVREGTQWHPIESESWLADLRQRIPAGLQIVKGVWPDLKTMQADAALYREGDANCCPTGGTARVRLAIRMHRLVIDSVVMQDRRSAAARDRSR
jgi:hypothetical protein